MNNFQLIQKIESLKKEKNAVILAHYYQNEDIQKVADFVGDSYGLSIEAAKTDAEIIVFAGVHFMAETAKILNPTKKVLLPDLAAGCSLAESCEYDEFQNFVKNHPNHKVVTYINCSAEIKSISDVVCTSSNAIKIIESYPKDQALIFAPDKNLGRYLAAKANREILLWDGSCIVHEAFSFDKLLNLFHEVPNAKIVAHPESHKDILDVAHFIGSTSEMIDYVKKCDSINFIVATEAGILYKMKQAAPNKVFIPAPAYEDNTCACSECSYMKLNTLEKIHDCLINEFPAIELSEELIDLAKKPIDLMIAITEDGKAII